MGKESFSLRAIQPMKFAHGLGERRTITPAPSKILALHCCIDPGLDFFMPKQHSIPCNKVLVDDKDLLRVMEVSGNCKGKGTRSVM